MRLLGSLSNSGLCLGVQTQSRAKELQRYEALELGVLHPEHHSDSSPGELFICPVVRGSLADHLVQPIRRGSGKADARGLSLRCPPRAACGGTAAGGPRSLLAVNSTDDCQEHSGGDRRSEHACHIRPHREHQEAVLRIELLAYVVGNPGCHGNGRYAGRAGE